MINIKHIQEKINKEGLYRKVVRVDLKGGSVIRGILYGRYCYTAEKRTEGLYLITFTGKRNEPVVIDLTNDKIRSLIVDIGRANINIEGVTKNIREYERKLDEVQKEKMEFYEEKRKQHKREGENKKNKKTVKELSFKESLEELSFEDNNKGLGL